MIVGGIILLVTNGFSQTITLSELRSFPSAEGYGKYSCVGQPVRSVYYVTNLNDSGPGSLRDAVSQSNRVILFKVSGTITLSSEINTSASNLYIAGQTAFYDGGQGITVRADGSYKRGLFIFSGNHVVMRYLRLRRGPGVMTGEVNGDNVNFFANDWIADHCSISWSTDENISASSNSNRGTMQYCISSEGLYFSSHDYTRNPSNAAYQNGHSKGAIFGFTGSYVNDITFYRNLFAHNDGRNPLIVSPGGRIEIVNNLLYNNRYSNIQLNANSSTVGIDMETNVVKNLLIAGRDTRTSRYMVDTKQSVNDRIYMQGNIGTHRTNDTQPEWDEVGDLSNPINQTGRSLTPFSTLMEPNYNDLPNALDLQPLVLNDVGANLNPDAVDDRIINDVINLTPTVQKTVTGTSAQWTGASTYYGIINDPAEVGGWPTIAPMNSIVTDVNDDGIDDTWATSHGVTSWNQIKSTYTIAGKTIINNAGYTARQIYLAYMAGDFNRLQTTASQPLDTLLSCNNTSSILIDGIEEPQWGSGYTDTIKKIISGTITNDNDASAIFKLMWDNSDLYILVDVKDDTLTNDSPNEWLDDGIEIYIDGNNEKGTSYDANDHKYTIRWNDNTVYEFGVGTNPAGVVFAQTNQPNGYIVEGKIAWSSIGVTPTANKPVGFDIELNDDDNGGNTDGRRGWNSLTAPNFNPSLMGTIKLTSQTCFNTTVVSKIQEEGILIFPNPTDGEITIKSLNTISKLEFYNTLGSLVLSKSNLNTKEEKTNINKLPKGLYVIKVYTINGLIEKQIIKQ